MKKRQAIEAEVDGAVNAAKFEGQVYGIHRTERELTIANMSPD